MNIFLQSAFIRGRFRDAPLISCTSEIRGASWCDPESQNSSFNANWSCREVVAVFVIWPADSL